MLLAEEAGYAALPWPLVETAAVAVPVLAGADGFGPEVAAAVVAGEVVVAARLLGAGPVPFARRADAAVVLDESGALVWVALGDAGQRDERAGPAPVKVVDSVDGARGLAPVDARDGRLVTDDPMLIDSAFNRGALGTAAVLVGLARRMLDLTVSHVKERRQFGVPIGSFQAVKHHLADGLRHIELTRPAVARAAWSLATGAETNPRTCRGSPLIARPFTTSSGFHHRGDHQMAEAYIIDAVRSPVGKRGGGLSHIHPADLGAHAISALVDPTGIDPGAVDDVIFGNVDSVGGQAGDIARTCWLVAGMPEHVPGTTVDRQCGSAQQAVHFAAQAVMAGVSDVIVAGGVQQMSQIPIGSAMTLAQPLGFDDPFRGSPGWVKRYGDGEVSQFRGAELIAERWDISREDMEAFAVESHQRALRAQADGRFDGEIAPLEDLDHDEGPRQPNWDKIRSLPPLVEGGRVTAAVASQISDASAALLVVSERALTDHGLTPRARIHHMSVRGDDPIFMLTAPIPATSHALARTGLTLDDIDRVEINEAFASVVLAWQRELDADLAKVNVNGGAIALGHPLGATGARLMTTLLNELDRTGGRYGLQTMCEGGGQANVTIIERLG